MAQDLENPGIAPEAEPAIDLSATTTRQAPPTSRFDPTVAPALGEGEDAPPHLVDDRAIESMITGAKILVAVVYLGAVVTFAMLAVGFLLMLFGASPEAPFVDWIYRNTAQAMKPFRGMFPVREIDGRSVFDPSLLFAAALYGFMAIGLHAVVEYLSALARRWHRRSLAN